MCMNSKTVGMITAIQKFCINDGPGIRTTVFMKGCPLNCIWCHNPETKSFSPEMFYDVTKCIGCRACLKACPIGCHSFDQQHHYDRENCTYCGRCVKACATQALELSGKELSVEEIIEEVMKDKIFYDNSGGGMTLSGGEPLAQPSFTLSLLEQAKNKGLHTCIDTCGFAPEAYIRQIAPYVDIFLYDYKETDPVRHKEFTGVTNERILSNLRLLDSLGANIILRCPIIPTKNDNEENILKLKLQK